jgi:PhnB protein
MAKVKAVPEGLTTLTPQLVVDGAEKAIAWYQKALGAEVVGKVMDPGGKLVWHAALRIGNAQLYLNDVMPGMGGGAERANLWVYGDDVDGRWKRAVEAGGAKVTMPLADQFWGDRVGQFEDPFGNKWTLAQRVKEPTLEEMEQASREFAASQATKG